MRCAYSILFLLAWLVIGEPSQAQSDSAAQPAEGRADLPPLLEFVDGRRVESIEDFAKRREEIRRLMTQYFIGTFPEKTPSLVKSELLSSHVAKDESKRSRIRLTWSTPNRKSFEIRVWKPKGDGPFPLLLTQPRYYQIEWAEMALARGYMVALYPGVDSHHRERDFPGYDSVWQSFRKEYPKATWSEIAAKAWLASRTIDYLSDENTGHKIAKEHIAIIGFSRYGKQSLIAAAFDERITSVVARSPGSPGSSPYRFTSRDTFAEAPKDFPSEWFLPSLRAFTGREHELPMDAHGWYALIAPRRCLIHTAHNDGSEPTFAVERAYLEGRKVYRLLGRPENLRVLYRTGQHGPITAKQRRENLDWFDLSFGRGDAKQADFPEELIHAFDWKQWKTSQDTKSLNAPSRGRPESDRERRAAIEWMLGQKPKDIEAASDLPFLTAAESEMMTHDRWAVPGVKRAPIRFGEGVRGNAYFPADSKKPLPVVIWLHPYSYHSGYNEGYGVQGTTVYHRLAKEGFFVIAFDQCGFGLRLLEGRDFYTKNPAWSKLGRMVHDVSAAVDFVIAEKRDSASPLPTLDRKNIAVLGYAVGGLVALHAAALDARISLVGAYSPMTPFRSDSSLRTGGRRRLWEWHGLLPKLGLFEEKPEEIPYDLEDLLKLISPRPCHVQASRHDRSIDVSAVLEAANRATTELGVSGLWLSRPDAAQSFQRAEHDEFSAWYSSKLKER